jgi:hypothetical protein
VNILSKIILTFISITIFVFLIFVTYITNSFSSFEKPYYENLKLWTFDLHKNEDWIFSFSDITSDSKIFVNRINLSDKIIFSTWSVETKTESWSMIISVTPWVYFFDLKEISSKYIIKWIWFEINNKWPWTFIINNLDPKKNIIISINSALDLNLKHYKTNEQIASLDLYPHTYLLFNPIKNIFVKNSDLLKISQTFTIWYFNDKILNNDIVNEKFIELASLNIENNKKIISESLYLIKQELVEKNNTIQKFIKLNFGMLPWEQLINKYIVMLKNPSKKSLYYKNIITRNLHKLLTTDSLNIQTVNIIVNYTKLLKEIDKEWYNEMENIINFYYGSVIQSNQKINTKINFSNLLIKINKSNIKLNLTSFIYLEKMFFLYDFIENKNIYSDMSIFRQKYFEDLNIKIAWNEINEAWMNNIQKVDYLLFFIENILISDFSSSDIDTEDLITIFSDYVNIANSFYSYSDEKIKRTWIFSYSKILNKFVKIFEGRYFNEEKNENNLLVINENQKITIANSLIFKENIENIFNYYNDFKSTLKPDINNKDKYVIKLYSTLKLKYEEYFSALENYEEYITKYDKSKQQLINPDSFNETNKTLVLSYSHAMDYLQNFNWIQLKYINITIMDYSYCMSPTLENSNLPVEVPYCYKIENLLIDSNNVSFLLFPLDKNKIDEIVIENKIEYWSYKLDDIKTQLDEKIKTETKDKDKYDFKNFLVSTFGQKNTSINEYDPHKTQDTILEEDSAVKIFKRNKLLWEFWDFANLGSFLEINYNDIIVKKENDVYYTNIKFWLFNIDLWNNKFYYWEFSSDYNFSPDHSFINPRIKIIDKKYEKDLLLWNYIDVIWQYKVNLIEEEIKEVFYHFEQINSIVNNISQILWNSEIKISYIKDTNIIEFETFYNWSNINITLNNWNITKVMYNNINRIQEALPYSELTKILNNIK